MVIEEYLCESCCSNACIGECNCGGSAVSHSLDDVGSDCADSDNEECKGEGKCRCKAHIENAPQIINTEKANMHGYGTMRHISILYRLARVFYNESLKEYQIGCGQEFFLVKINENPGITILELAQTGYFDNASATRAVMKLEALGYIKVIACESDKRIKRLYVTENAIPVIKKTREIRNRWRDAILSGFTDDEKDGVLAKLKIMSSNAMDFVTKNRSEQD